MHTKNMSFQNRANIEIVSIPFVRICSINNIMTLKISSRKKSQFPLFYYVLNLHCTLKCSCQSRFTFSRRWEPVCQSLSLFSRLPLCTLPFPCPRAPNPSCSGSKINRALVSSCWFSFSPEYWTVGGFWGFTLGHTCSTH